MARGMAAGEPIVSQAQSEAFDKGWEEMEHKDDGRRGRFVWDPAQGKLVRPGELFERRALDAPVMVGRFYENMHATDGTDIGSRRKREAYMKANGLADPSDFKGHLKQKRAERDRFYATGHTTAASEKRAREVTERVMGQIVESRQKDYDKGRAKREDERARRGKGFEP